MSLVISQRDDEPPADASRTGWFAQFRAYLRVAFKFLWKPQTPLSSEEKQKVERRLLLGLARRTAYWILMIIFLSLVVVFSGDPNPNPLLKIFTAHLWASGFLLFLPPYLFLLWVTFNISRDSSRSKLFIMELAWSSFAVLIALYWFCGNFTLPTQVKAVAPPNNILTHQFFLILTLQGHVTTLLLLSPTSRISALLVIVVGYLLPFIGMYDTFVFQSNKIIIIWVTIQLLTYSMIIWFLYRAQRRVYNREIRVEREQIRLEQERERADKERIRAEGERAQAEDERSRTNLIIASISHDVRQPLTALALKLNAMAGKKISDTHHDDIISLQHQTRAIEEMVKGAFDLSRLQAGTWAVNVREVALPQLLERVTENLREDASEKHIELDLTAEALPYVVKTDPVALERILRNLLSNAIRYTPAVTASGNPGKVKLSCKVKGDAIRISVTDNGIGIPADKRDDIFKEYVQLANPERDRTKGFGLGLSIVKGLANLLDHKIKVESEEGIGSRFSVFVPIIGRLPEELPAKFEIPDLTGMVVAFIEDDRAPREALCERLLEWGCYVMDGESAEEVAQKIRRADTHVHFVLSDFRLREGKTGVEAIHAIRDATNSPNLPAAIWTAETDSQKLRAMAEAGFELLSKPLDEERFASILKAHAPIPREVAAE